MSRGKCSWGGKRRRGRLSLYSPLRRPRFERGMLILGIVRVRGGGRSLFRPALLMPLVIVVVIVSVIVHSEKNQLRRRGR